MTEGEIKNLPQWTKTKRIHDHSTSTEEDT
jgi:hypothetical protein